MSNDFVHLPADSNQALGIARYAIDFMSSDPAKAGRPDESVLRQTNRFMTDAAVCGISALALGTNAPTILRAEALDYPANGKGATVFGSNTPVRPEKAIVANCAAVREWDSNGTNFGYNPGRGQTAGEFGHNDFYAVAIAAAQMTGAGGARALLGMVCHDEIRGRLAEVFSLKTYKIDHVLHGAIASAAVYGAMMGATAEQIESAIGMVVAHYVPFRAIRAGKQLSDSKGSSAAISTEAAILSVQRSMRGFLGPRDIFRNPEAVFRIFEGPGQMFWGRPALRAGVPDVGSESRPTRDASPFDLYLARSGSDFAVMGMHFKLGLYEHQSAGAIQAMIDLCAASPGLLEKNGEGIRTITITAYEPAFGIIGDPAKRNPTTRQSADHSMVYIIATLLRKAIEGKAAGRATRWEDLILLPEDYSAAAIQNPLTRTLMDKIRFAHGGAEYDSKYPDGIPTGVVIESADGKRADSGLVMYPAGHARNTTHDLDALLANKWKRLGSLAAAEPGAIIAKFEGFGTKSAAEVAGVHDFAIEVKGLFE